MEGRELTYAMKLTFFDTKRAKTAILAVHRNAKKRTQADKNNKFVCTSPSSSVRSSTQAYVQSCVRRNPILARLSASCTYGTHEISIIDKYMQLERKKQINARLIRLITLQVTCARARTVFYYELLVVKKW